MPRGGSSAPGELHKSLVRFTRPYRCQKRRAEAKNRALLWRQICAAVQFSQHSPCSLWLTSTPAAALQVSCWHTACRTPSCCLLHQNASFPLHDSENHPPGQECLCQGVGHHLAPRDSRFPHQLEEF